MKDSSPDQGEGNETVHHKLIYFAASFKGCIEHVVHPGKSDTKDAQRMENHDNTTNKPGGLKAVAGGLLQFKPFHRHNVIVVSCLKHLFFCDIAFFSNVDAPEPTQDDLHAEGGKWSPEIGR